MAVLDELVVFGLGSVLLWVEESVEDSVGEESGNTVGRVVVVMVVDSASQFEIH